MSNCCVSFLPFVFCMRQNWSFSASGCRSGGQTRTPRSKAEAASFQRQNFRFSPFSRRNVCCITWLTRGNRARKVRSIVAVSPWFSFFCATEQVRSGLRRNFLKSPLLNNEQLLCIPVVLLGNGQEFVIVSENSVGGNK